MELQKKLVQYRRELHRFPELSMKEYQTTRNIRRWLTENGIALLDYPLEVGAVAEVKGAMPGPTIALRADIDALPISETSGVEFASQNPGVMHACGHDFHTASMLGTAILLQQMREKLKGSVRIIFQPAEETAAGAKWIVQKGVLKDVKAIFGFHNRPDLKVGVIGIREGALMASVDRFEIILSGRGGHAGMPEKCIDPIVLGSQTVLAIQSIVSRRLSSFDNAVVSITHISSGNTWNVIPDQIYLEGTVRTFQKGARDQIPVLLNEIVDGIAAANGAQAQFIWHPLLPMVDNFAGFTSLVTETAREEGLNIVEGERNSGGEDFAYYQTILPGFFVWMGVEGDRDWHHPAFHLKEEALVIVARYFARLAQNALAELQDT